MAGKGGSFFVLNEFSYSVTRRVVSHLVSSRCVASRHVTSRRTVAVGSFNCVPLRKQRNYRAIKMSRSKGIDTDRSIIRNPLESCVPICLYVVAVVSSFSFLLSRSFFLVLTVWTLRGSLWMGRVPAWRHSPRWFTEGVPGMVGARGRRRSGWPGGRWDVGWSARKGGTGGGGGYMTQHIDLSLVERVRGREAHGGGWYIRRVEGKTE